jgi:hypothetical protein
LRRKGIVAIGTACLAASLACSGAGFLSPARSPIPASTPTAIPSPTFSPTQTATPLPTRTASPTLIPGLEEPIKAGDAELLIAKALLRDTFRCGASSEPVENPERTIYLILIVTVEGGPKSTSAQLEKWIRETEIDQWALHFSGPGVAGACFGFSQLCTKRDKDTLALSELDIAFDLDITADSFRLALPNGTEIPLDSLVP